MRDFLTIGPTPSDEDCQQAPYTDRGLAHAECEAFIAQLIRVFGDPPEGASFGVHTEDHEFGQYFEVVIWYNDRVKEAVDFAYYVENRAPTTWDDEARESLARYKTAWPLGVQS